MVPGFSPKWLSHANTDSVCVGGLEVQERERAASDEWGSQSLVRGDLERGAAAGISPGSDLSSSELI